MMVRLPLCIMLCLLFFSVCGQEIPGSVKQQLENWAETTEAEAEDDYYLQQMEYLRRRPLSLNTAADDDLQVFYFLSDRQIQNLLRYRRIMGNLVSIYELQAVPGWDIATIRKVLPYITIENPLSVKNDLWPRLVKGGHQAIFRFSRVPEMPAGYDTSLRTHFSGNPDHLLLRYRYQYQNLLQYGITADKDPGEEFFKGTQPRGFDFYSAHLFARNLGAVKALAVGDFTVNMGQGLIQWQSLAFKKSSDVLSIKRQSPVLKPYSSSGEFYFNRGAGITIKKGKVEGTAFASLRKIDANTANDTLDNQDLFTGFQTSGFHRTPAEIADRNSTRQSSLGGNVSYEGRFFKVGMNAVGYRFSRPLRKRAEPYNLFTWKGDTWSNISADYSLMYRNVYVFGEAAMDKGFNKAFLNGALISVDPKIDISLLHRHISEKYQSVYGNAFTENVAPSNESGMYAGIRIRPFSKVTVDGYADVYRFPWLKYRVDAPGYGSDYLLQLTWHPNKEVELYTRYRGERKDVNEFNETYNNPATNYVTQKLRQQWRVHLSCLLSSKLSAKSRMDMVWYDRAGKNAEKGFLFYTEAHIKSNSRLAGNLRLQYFETGGYNSRLYAYENDVLYSYSVPAFFDKGFRYYVNMHYEWSKQFSVWMRWAQTVYNGKEVVGSAFDAIKGNRKSEIKMQFQFVFL